MDTRTSEATRYLCASAHLNFGFCTSLLKQVFAKDLKGPIRSLGVDMRAVIVHAIGARRRKMIRDAVLLSLMLPLIIFGLLLVVSPWFTVPVMLTVLTMYVVVTREAWISRYGIAARFLSKNDADPYGYEVRIDTLTQAKIEQAVREQDASNLIVYSGYTPFVGYGYDVGGWSFVVNLRQGKQDLLKRGDPISFKTEELYAFLHGKIEELRIDGVQQRDILCVDGQDVRGRPEFLPVPTHRPNVFVPSEIVGAHLSQAPGRVRYYHCLEFDSWGGQLVVTLFYRLNQVGQNLLVETKYLITPPLKKRLCTVDKLGKRPSFLQTILFLMQTALLTPVVAIGSFNVLYLPYYLLLDALTFEREKASAARNLAYDYGAKKSLRQTLSGDRFSSYFQQLDQDMYVKIAERQLLDSLVEFLDSKNIDTSDIKDRATAILNNGVIMSGGSISGQSVSLGQRAKAAVKGVAGKQGAETKPTVPSS